jgi:hypothetical protein
MTKDFIITEANKITPGLKIRSGVWYRLNRWREEHCNSNRVINYGDLVNHFVYLNNPDTELSRVEHGRYINFITDFMKYETGATREEGIQAWHELKQLNSTKHYSEWKKLKRSL